jgi:hypothetical protein
MGCTDNEDIGWMECVVLRKDDLFHSAQVIMKIWDVLIMKIWDVLIMKIWDVLIMKIQDGWNA